MINRRYLLVAVALILSLAGFEKYALAPRTEELRERLETAYKALKKDEQFIQNAGMTEKNAAGAADELTKLEGRLIREKTEFLATARLQDEVSGLAEEAGLKMLTIRPLPAVKTGDFNAVAVSYEGNGTIRQLSDFLSRLEAGALLVKIDKLGLTITSMQNHRELKFKIQVSGLARS
ncbi:MAG: GspMb/PilO family protein [Thermodesulfovibrionales bacterium]